MTNDLLPGAAGTGRRIYLAGPMTGYAEHNYPLFRFVSAQLRLAGHFVYSPHERLPQTEEDRVGTVELREAFADYCRFICLEADTMVLLPGWSASRGAKAEHQLAVNCGLDVLLWDDPIDMVDVLPQAAKCPRMPVVDDGRLVMTLNSDADIATRFEATIKDMRSKE